MTTQRQRTRVAAVGRGALAGLAAQLLPQRAGCATGSARNPAALEREIVEQPEPNGAFSDALEEWARQDGAERLTLWVAQSNEPARSLYHSHGFEWSERRKPLPSSSGVEERQMLLSLN
jgi:GNAT superfamily N-acetyltransferase